VSCLLLVVVPTALGFEDVSRTSGPHPFGWSLWFFATPIGALVHLLATPAWWVRRNAPASGRRAATVVALAVVVTIAAGVGVAIFVDATGEKQVALVLGFVALAAVPGVAAWLAV
jgi:uncharacterized membrane protein